MMTWKWRTTSKRVTKDKTKLEILQTLQNKEKEKKVLKGMKENVTKIGDWTCCEVHISQPDKMKRYKMNQILMRL